MKTLLILAVFAAPCFAQTTQIWVTVGNEGDALTLPVGAVVRYGDLANNKWVKPITITAANASLVASNALPGGDPDVGTVKVLQIVQTSAAQKYVDNGVARTVPALPVPSTTYTLNCTGPATLTGTTLTSNSLSCTLTAVAK